MAKILSQPTNIAVVKPSSSPNWVKALPLWQWYSIPNTALSSVTPSQVPLGQTGPSSKISAWCGATLKKQGSVYLIGCAGGHGDYSGNEVDALVLNTEIPKWEQICPPTPNSLIVDAAQFYLDKKPSATHTYCASQFINSMNRMLIVASPGMGWPSLPQPPADWPYKTTRYTASFNFATKTWDEPEFISPFPLGEAGDFTACLCVKHPETEEVFYSRNYSEFYKWNPSVNSAQGRGTWSQLAQYGRSPWYAGSAIDPVRRRMLIVGGYSPAPPEVRGLDAGAISVTFSGLGAGALTLNNYPGVVYVDALDIFLVAFNDSASNSIKLYKVTADTFHVETVAATGTPPAQRPNGIHNSIQYVPELKGIVIANSFSGNVQFMRLAA